MGTNGTSASVVLASSDATIAPGPPGIYIDGIAEFDDLRVATSCAAADGSCRSGASNTATGLGSVCAYTCPAGYVSTGSFMQACSNAGTWSGSTLVCAPAPPVFTMQVCYVTLYVLSSTGWRSHN